MREIALDTETTGLDPASGHRVVEIGCVEMVNRVRTGRVFHAYLNPERDMPEQAYRIHGLSAEFLADKPLFNEVVEDMLSFLEDAPLVIHNAGFDMKFLNAELVAIAQEEIPLTRAVDTLTLARKKFPGSPNSLDALCKRFSIDLSARDKHGALLDAELLADMYLALTGGSQVTLALAAKSPAQKQTTTTESTTTARPARAHAANDDEKAAHTAFLTRLTEPIWES